MPVLGTQVIKSIQRGSTTGSGTTTINAVDLSKSFVSASFANGYGRGQIYQEVEPTLGFLWLMVLHEHLPPVLL